MSRTIFVSEKEAQAREHEASALIMLSHLPGRRNTLESALLTGVLLSTTRCTALVYRRDYSDRHTLHTVSPAHRESMGQYPHLMVAIRCCFELLAVFTSGFTRHPSLQRVNRADKHYVMTHSTRR